MRLHDLGCFNYYIKIGMPYSGIPNCISKTKTIVFSLSNLCKMLIESDDCLYSFEEMIDSVVLVR